MFTLGNLEFLNLRKSINGDIILKDFDGVYHLKYFNTSKMGVISEVISQRVMFLGESIEANIEKFRMN
jgi:hypothetical protein